MELKSPPQYHFRQFLLASFEDQLPRSLKMDIELHSTVRDFAHLFHVWTLIAPLEPSCWYAFIHVSSIIALTLRIPRLKMAR